MQTQKATETIKPLIWLNDMVQHCFVQQQHYIRDTLKSPPKNVNNIVLMNMPWNA